MSMFTDPDHIRIEDPGKLEGNTVFTYLDAFCQPEHFAEFLPDYQNLDELKAHYTRGGLGDVKVKKFLNNVMQSLLSPMRERRAQWEGRACPKSTRFSRRAAKSPLRPRRVRSIESVTR